MQHVYKQTLTLLLSDYSTLIIMKRSSKVYSTECKWRYSYTLYSGNGDGGIAQYCRPSTLQHVIHLCTNCHSITSQYWDWSSVKVSFTPPCIVLSWAYSVIKVARWCCLESILDAHWSKECLPFSISLHISIPFCGQKSSNWHFHIIFIKLHFLSYVHLAIGE